MGQQVSSSQQSNRYYSKSNESCDIYNKKIQHQGLLKVRSVPFNNCIQIQSGNGCLFLQNINITLKDLQCSRLYTNKLFPLNDIQSLIQNITYTLADLQSNSIPYKNLCQQNIYYDQGKFKLLPNLLVQMSTFQRFLNTRKQMQAEWVCLSPEMIIAYRCREKQILDLDILDKSNVFSFGMILLQVTTLLPSFQCYDQHTNQICDHIVSERIQMVKQFYNQEIASIIANMLDYDYTERMNLKQTAIFVNRQLYKDGFLPVTLPIKEKQSRIYQNTQSKSTVSVQIQSKNSQSHVKSTITQKSRIKTSQQAQFDKSQTTQSRQISQNRKNKTNKIYMNKQQSNDQYQGEQSSTLTKQQRNKIYMKQSNIKINKRSAYTDNSQANKSPGVLRQISSNLLSRMSVNTYAHEQQQQYFNNNEKYLAGTRQNRLSNQLNRLSNIQLNTSSNYMRRHQKARVQENNQQQQQNTKPFKAQQSRKNLKRKDSSDYLGYRAPLTLANRQVPQRFADRQSESYLNYNAKQLNFGQRQDSHSNDNFEQNQSSHYYDQKKSKRTQQSHQQDHSLSRIKSEIERSRKLIQEFKRSDNRQY